MMSARDLALAALSDAIESQTPNANLQQTNVGSMDANSTNNYAATSIESGEFIDSKNDLVREANASTNAQRFSNSISQDTSSTASGSDALSSQSQESQEKLSQSTILTEPVSQDPKYGLAALSAASSSRKRTYDGETKSSILDSAPASAFVDHSRTTSTWSIASSAASSRELASELRTRLSYAMTKVSKGWESLPIDEVESLTSQNGSPSSSNSTIYGRRNAVISPRMGIAGTQAHHPDNAQYTTNTLALSSSSQRDPILFSETQPSRTYESFWREQSQRPVAHSHSISNVSAQPVLGPPANITSASQQTARRSATPNVSRPPLLTNLGSDLSQHSAFSPASVPRTPNRGPPVAEAIIRTPRDKSAQEREAIETLMFMGSPSNPSSQVHTFSPLHQASQQPSPLRAEFESSHLNSRVRVGGFPISHHTDSLRNVPSRGRYISRPLSGAELDRMLDSPDDSSDDEIEIPISPRRLAAGRV